MTVRTIRRLIWLVVRLVQKREINFLAYHDRFKLTIRTYYRDLQTLERCGVRTKSHRDHGRVLLSRLDV